MSYQVLLVEDDPQIREVIEDFFTGKDDNKIHIISAKDGREGLDYMYEQEYDLVLLDIMLPGVDGFQLCGELRGMSSCPIIFLTAKAQESDVLYGYSLGCDDYIIKPFSLNELYAKVNALLKRSKGLVGTEELSCGQILLNPVSLTVKVLEDGKEQLIQLPPKEYTILKYLLEHKDQVVGREQLLVRIWGYDYDGSDRVVDNHIKKLRKALGKAGSQIKTVVTKGYKIAEE